MKEEPLKLTKLQQQGYDDYKSGQQTISALYDPPEDFREWHSGWMIALNEEHGEY